MDARTFDRLTAAGAHRPTRRAALRVLAGGLLGGLLAQRGAAPARAQDEPVPIDIVSLPPSYVDPVYTCASQGLTNCGGVCVDVSGDPANCGACGSVCSAGDACSGGWCQTLAPTGVDLGACGLQGLTDCGGVCVGLSADPNHCGACFNSCPLGGFCQGGACTGLICSDGLVDCGGGSCVDTSSDPGNCGACFNSCPLGGFCQGGACGGIICQGGQTDCGGYCADLQNDQYNCGACHNLCDSGECGGGRCGAICYGPGTVCTDDSDCCSGDCGLDEIFGGGVCL